MTTALLGKFGRPEARITLLGVLLFPLMYGSPLSAQRAGAGSEKDRRLRAIADPSGAARTMQLMMEKQRVTGKDEEFLRRTRARQTTRALQEKSAQLAYYSKELSDRLSNPHLAPSDTKSLAKKCEKLIKSIRKLLP